LRIFRDGREGRAGGWRVPRPGLVIAAACLCVAALAAPAPAQARDLVVYGEPTLKTALKSVGTLWQARTGTRVNVFVAPSDLSYAQIDRGARCDLIFALAGSTTEAAARNKIIHADTIERAFRNGLVLIGSDGGATPAPNASLADISKLIAGKRLAIANPDRDAAGAYAADLLRRIGIGVDDDNKSVAVAENSAGVVSLLATNKARLGIVYATDAVAGFKLTVPLPALDRPPIEYVVAQARDPVMDTRPFIAFLRSAEAKATLKSAGLQSTDEVDTSAER